MNITLDSKFKSYALAICVNEDISLKMAINNDIKNKSGVYIPQMLQMYIQALLF